MSLAEPKCSALKMLKIKIGIFREIEIATCKTEF